MVASGSFLEIRKFFTNFLLTVNLVYSVILVQGGINV